MYTGGLGCALVCDSVSLHAPLILAGGVTQGGMGRGLQVNKCTVCPIGAVWAGWAEAEWSLVCLDQAQPGEGSLCPPGGGAV